LALHKFESIDLAFHLSVAPRQDNGGDDGVGIAIQSITESDDFWQACPVRFHNPVLEGVTLLGPEYCGETLRQAVKNGDLGAAFVQFGKELPLRRF
jgi:hypothetical protein